MSEQFKRCLYQTCSPTLRRVKPSSLFTLHKSRCPSWRQDLAECRSTLRRHGYDAALLQETTDYVVVMLYHTASLRSCLARQELQTFLTERGYQPAQPLEAKLALLSSRFHREDFPHEIGLFLGYPMDDVAGFIANQGRNSKFTGDWKVYGDVNRARKIFGAYQDSRRVVRYLADRGLELEDILVG